MSTCCCVTDSKTGTKPKIKTVSIEARADNKFKVAVKAGEHILYVDQPAAGGGTDAGANPMEYLLASLAGCLATTARIIANQQKLDLHGMDIKVEGSVDISTMLGNSQSQDSRPGVTGINVSVALDSAMSEIERQHFMEELQLRCPISDMIAVATPITITAV